MAKFIKAIQVNDFNSIANPRIGQWYKNDLGQSGQYLGETKTGTICFAWKCQQVKRHAMQVKAIRKFAKTNGAI